MQKPFPGTPSVYVITYFKCSSSVISNSKYSVFNSFQNGQSYLYIFLEYLKNTLISAFKLIPLTSLPSLVFPLSISNSTSVTHFLCPMPDQGVGSHSARWQEKLTPFGYNVSLLREAFSFTSPFSDHKTCSGQKDREVHCSSALFCFLHKFQ